MRIAIDLTALADNFSGIERFTAMISYRLIKENATDNFVLFFKREVYAIFKEFHNYKNVKIVVLKECKKLIFSQFVLPITMYRYKADRWLFMAFPTPLFYFRKGTITAIHDIGCWDLPEAMTVQSRIFFRCLYRVAACRDYKLLTVSNFSKKRIIAKLNVRSDKIKVIYNGLSEESYAYSKDLNKIKKIREKYHLPERYILCLSTLEPRKNLPLLINACCELWKENKLVVNLVLAGRKGWKVNDLLSGLDKVLTDRIIFTGFIDDEDLPTVYHESDVFVFPSRYEGFGIPPLEALAVHTNVISSDISSLSEVLGDAVIYFKNNDLKDLKDKIVKFYKGERAIGNLPRKYDWENSVKELRMFLETR